jgi:hypothetical protein
MEIVGNLENSFQFIIMLCNSPNITPDWQEIAIEATDYNDHYNQHRNHYIGTCNAHSRQVFNIIVIFMSHIIIILGEVLLKFNSTQVPDS